CAHIEDPGPNRIRSLAAAVEDLVVSDYYVVAASTANPADLDQLDAVIRSALDTDSVREAKAKVLKIVAGEEVVGFSEAIARGAKECGIDDVLRDQIFSLFRFESQKVHLDRGSKLTEYLLFGGRLNARQARIVADFLNESVLTKASIGPSQDKLGLKS